MIYSLIIALYKRMCLYAVAALLFKNPRKNIEEATYTYSCIAMLIYGFMSNKRSIYYYCCCCVCVCVPE